MIRHMQSLGWRVILPAVAVLGAVGCTGLTQPYPQKNLYVIAADGSPVRGDAHGASVLRVPIVRIAKPFDERTFVYRTGESAFTVDYYNGFLTDPDRLLTGELSRWLAESGLFAAVVGSSTVDHDLTLETNVTSLYGDYSVKGSPQAVIEARFVLIREEGMAYKVIFQDTCRQVEPLAGMKPEDLIHGWGRAYRRILEKLTASLQTVVAPASRPAP
jgi:cholesterol transport system auxiliary component